LSILPRRLVSAFLRIAYRVMKVYWFFRRPVTLGVRVLLVNEGKVLLVRHTYQNAWFLPGGGVKRGETLEQAMRREALEEAGVRVGRLKLFGVYTGFYENKNDHTILFTAEEFSSGGKPDAEIEKVDWFQLDRLPKDISPGSRRRVEDYLKGQPPEADRW
jgi:8-oxo-dGTP pyrophosphatase MutT (NUDIX family)